MITSESEAKDFLKQLISSASSLLDCYDILTSLYGEERELIRRFIENERIRTGVKALYSGIYQYLDKIEEEYLATKDEEE